MQFFGYLRRNPNDLPDSDYTGYEFWLNKLNQFNGNYNAAEMSKPSLSRLNIASASGREDYRATIPVVTYSDEYHRIWGAIS